MIPLTDEQREACADLAGAIAKEAEHSTYSDNHYRQVFLSRLRQLDAVPPKVTRGAPSSDPPTAQDAEAAELTQKIRAAVAAAVAAGRAVSNTTIRAIESVDEREAAALAIVAASRLAGS